MPALPWRWSPTVSGEGECQADVSRVGAHLDRQRRLGDEPARGGPDDAAADDVAGRLVEQQLRHSLGATKRERAAAGRSTRAHLALGEAAAARAVLSESERVLKRRPDLGGLAEEARELRERVAATSSPAGSRAMSLTAAELRLLPYLATHLNYPEIGQRLFISRHTVKAEATSIFRKLSASSRSEAIERAVEVGLLESSIYPPRAIFT
jgi:DNA-binding CsgD family transcriptional regulator